MDLSTFLWTNVAAFFTLATFSFLYKDNPFYKIAEHIVVGVSAGYFTVILWHTGLVPNLFARLADGDWYFLWLNSEKVWYIIPGLLGLMMFARFTKKYAWISRWPLALYIGIGTGIAIPLEMSTRVNKQLYASMQKIDWNNFFGTGLLDTASGFAALFVLVGSIASLVYFFFSKEHKGVFGGAAKLGIWILMIGFGASFGYTVMARISLFISRIQFLDKSWIQVAFDSSNPNYDPLWFMVSFWFVVLLVVGYIVKELMDHMKSKIAQE